jgi:hypothetical protein
MSALLMGIVAVIYLFTAVAFAFERNLGMAVAFFAYALANIGLIMATS